MIPDSVIEEVRARADLVEIIGEYIQLKRAGREFRALCPFHREKTPSFYVVPEKGFYKCFGCGEAGDVFTFLMKQQGLDFLESVRQLAARLGVDIPDDRTARREEEQHRELYEAIGFALDFYRRRLADEEAGRRARGYLDRRGIGPETADRFQLGYAPDAWRALREAAHRHGIEDAVLLEAGLIKTSERSDEPYDRLRNRLIFPILDVRGRAVAFGGRVLDGAAEDTPKYLNSPDTPIYHKGRVLYGLHWSRTAVRRAETALVVEGYMDYVSLAAAGVENVVAPLGTAMTPEQAALLSRYTGQALLLYDSDTAGLRATFRSADSLLRAGVHPLVVTLPPGEDPDSVVRAGGAAALKRYLDDAVDVVDRKLQILEQRGYLDGIEGRRKALDALMPTLRAAADAALRDLYVDRVAGRIGVRPETLERELERGGGRGNPWAATRPPRRGAGLGPATDEGGRDRQGSEPRRGRSAGPGLPPAGRAGPARDRAMGGVGGGAGEPRRPGLAGPRKLLQLMLKDETRIAQAAGEIRPEEIGDDVARELFRALIAHGRRPSPDEELGLSPVARVRLAELAADPEELADGDRIFADAVKDIRFEQLCTRLDELEARLAAARARRDDAALDRITLEKRDIVLELRTMGHPLERMVRKRVRVIEG